MNFVKRTILKGNNITQICVYNKKTNNIILLIDIINDNIQFNMYNADGSLDTNTNYKSIADYYLGLYDTTYYDYCNNKLSDAVMVNFNNGIDRIIKRIYYTYNDDDKIIKKKYNYHNRSYIINYDYDNLGRLVKEFNAESNRTKLINYNHGFRTEVIENTNNIEFRYYNKQNKIDTIKIINLNNPNRDKVYKYTYNNQNQEIKVTKNNNIISEKIYDNKGRLVQDLVSGLIYNYEDISYIDICDIKDILKFI